MARQPPQVKCLDPEDSETPCPAWRNSRSGPTGGVSIFDVLLDFAPRFPGRSAPVQARKRPNSRPCRIGSRRRAGQFAAGGRIGSATRRRGRSASAAGADPGWNRPPNRRGRRGPARIPAMPADPGRRGGRTGRPRSPGTGPASREAKFRMPNMPAISPFRRISLGLFQTTGLQRRMACAHPARPPGGRGCTVPWDWNTPSASALVPPACPAASP